MAKVYKARHVVLDTFHAVKVLDAKYRDNENVRTRFVDEARIQAKHLDHPNIVKVTNVISTSDAAALVMELVEGTSLDAEIPKLKSRPGEVVRIMLAVLDAVGYAHANGIIHRDLKPGNVLLARKGDKLVPKVTDFGIAKVNVAADVALKKKATHVDSRMGTLAYMSPEQMRSAKDVTARSDVFALGVMLYEMTTGVVPFDGESDYEIMDAVIKGRYEPPTKRNPQLGPNIVYAIEKALRADPARRFESCSEMAAALKGTTQPATKVADVQATVATEAKPVATKPVATKPVATKPAETKPAASKPPVSAVATPVSSVSTQAPAKSSSKLLGVILLVVALGVGGVAVVLAMKGEDAPKTNTGGAGARVNPLGVPADALTAPNGIRYKFLVEPEAGGTHPLTNYTVELRLTTFSDDGTPFPPREVTTKLGEDDSPGINELVPLLTPKSKLRGWIPLPGGAMTLVMDIELLSMRSRLDELRTPGAPSGGASTGGAPTGGAPSRTAPGARASPVVLPPPPPPPPPSASSGTAKYCTSSPARRDACQAFALPDWHFHGYVRHPNGTCMACWDEASNTCEELDGAGYRYINGNDCNGVPPAPDDPPELRRR